MTAAQKPAAPGRAAIAAARREFAVHNMMRGAEILRDAARQAVAKAARQRGWPCATEPQIYDAIAGMDSAELNLMGSYLHATGMPDKIRYRSDRIIAGELDMDCWAVGRFLERMRKLAGTQ